jgi:hypothetical protein
VFPLRSVAVTTAFEELEVVVGPEGAVYAWVLPFESVYVMGLPDELVPVGWMLVEV